MQVSITDTLAAESLVRYSVNHRAAIAHWALEKFKATTNPVEQASFAVEVFEKLVASVEDLEMLLYALRSFTADSSTAFLARYEGVNVREGKIRSGANETSALTLLVELKALDDEHLRSALGLPTAAEIHGRAAAGTQTLEEATAEYTTYLAAVRNVIEKALANRTEAAIMGSYNKIKHGFVVMHNPTDGLFLVSDVTSTVANESLMECKLFNPTADQLGKMVDTIKVISTTSRDLLRLRFNISL